MMVLLVRVWVPVTEKFVVVYSDLYECTCTVIFHWIFTEHNSYWHTYKSLYKYITHTYRYKSLYTTTNSTVACAKTFFTTNTAIHDTSKSAICVNIR